MTQKLSNLPAFKQLVTLIKQEIAASKALTPQAKKQEKKITYWNIGKHIKQYLLEDQKLREYGKKLIQELAKQIDISVGNLYRSVRFYEGYPKIVWASSQLTWSHYKALITVPDKALRKEYESNVIKKKLKTRDLKELIKINKKLSQTNGKPQLRLERGEPWVYRLNKVEHALMIDLGFMFYIESPDQNLKPDSVIKVAKTREQYRFSNQDTGAMPYYTYKAYVQEIIDGDTLWVNVDLGFNTWTSQRIRLKGINTPEIKTPEGQIAKNYIVAKLKDCKFIAIKTYWREKFNRYLADIFYDTKEPNITNLALNGKFLNQELLDKGYAVKY